MSLLYRLLVLISVASSALAVNPTSRDTYSLFPRAPEVDLSARWCGKHYRSGSVADSELVLAARTLVPEQGSQPLLSFTCRPAFRPYLEEDTSLTFVLDTIVSYDVGQPLPSDFSSNNTLLVNISLSDQSLKSILAQDIAIPSNTSGFEVSLDVSKFTPSFQPHNVTCKARMSNLQNGANQSSPLFQDQTRVLRLPKNPYSGSTTKLDVRTGGLLRRDEQFGSWRPIIPFGFYTYTDNLIANLSIIDAMVNDGHNVIHLVPTFAETVDEDALKRVLDHADALGMLYIADFRDKYKNLDNIEDLVKLFRARKNLLAWYTTDEPDGPGDDPTAAIATYTYLYKMDGYHPVSLVLNCADFRWHDYSAGADIVLSDAYPIAVNVTYSKRYNTVCNATYGCCGCDNCSGSYSDIGTRLDTWSERRRWLGRQRDLAFWTVPQAFDGTMEFWDRVPTGNEFKLQVVLGLNHGSVGITPWANPYENPGIAHGAAEIAGVVNKIAPLVLDPTARRFALRTNDSNVDAAAWTIGGSETNATVLVLVANMRAEVGATVSADVASLFGSAGDVSVRSMTTLVGNAPSQTGASLAITLGSTAVAGYVLSLQLDGARNDSQSSGVSSRQRNFWHVLLVLPLSALVLA